MGAPLNVEFWKMKFSGTSRLAVLVRLNMSRLYLAETLSENFVSLTMERSVRFCHACRKILRCPVVNVVSKGSLEGMAPLRAPGLSKGTVKQFALSAGPFTPLNPVYASLGVQFGLSGAI